MKPSQVPPFVCSVLEVPVDNVIGTEKKKPSKLREHLDARFIIIGIWRKRFKMGYSEIGRRLRMDHQTIINAVRRAGEWMETCSAFKDKMEEVQKAWNADPC